MLGLRTLMLTLAATPVFAQCVMCFRTAAAQQQERAHVLNAGILVLGVPPVLILGGFLLLAWVRRDGSCSLSASCF